MYKLILEDDLNNRLTFNDLGGKFQITEIQGLNPPSADINTNEVAMIDGQIYNSSKLQMRQINLAFAIDYDAEQARMEIYRVIHCKKPIRLYYRSEHRDVYISGYVKDVEIAYFDMKQVCTVTILCPQPYLKGAQEMVDELTAVNSMFHFPFASTAEPELVFAELDFYAHKMIENNSGIDTGMIIQLHSTSQIVNPKIYNYDTQDFIGLNMTMEAGDLITIDTSPGEKTITLLRNGVQENAFNYLAKNSTWLQLYPGVNEFYLDIESGQLSALFVTIKYRLNYEGV